MVKSSQNRVRSSLAESSIAEKEFVIISSLESNSVDMISKNFTSPIKMCETIIIRNGQSLVNLAKPTFHLQKIRAIDSCCIQAEAKGFKKR